MSDGATDPQTPLIVHASCVAVEGRALLIRGASGAGKSSLALQMMALGAQLVSDDRTELHLEVGQILACAPESIAGLIEARGLGILRANSVARAAVVAVIDLDVTEEDRLPPIREVEIIGQRLPSYYSSNNPALPAALMQLLKSGRHA